ncbi:replicative DNA helicase [Anaplasmataceae bacterium AB001_6]|nr:replicative DNA helicase [Anaplasmataceae bacterium AB001_6]
MISSKVYNLEIERAIIGAILIKNKVLFEIDDILDKQCFYDPLHQKSYESICTIVKNDSIAIPSTVVNLFDLKPEKLDEAKKYLEELQKDFSAFSDVKNFAKYLKDLFLRREAINLAGTFKSVVEKDYSRDIGIILEEGEKGFFNLSKSLYRDSIKPLSSSLNKAFENIQDAYKNKSSVIGITSGFYDIDNLTGGFQESDLIIVAGRPSMGKTALAVNMILNAVKNDNKSALFFSLEMSAEQIATRIVSMESKVNAFKLRTGKLTEDEFRRVMNSKKMMEDMKLFFDDTPAMTINGIRSQIRRMCAKEDVSIIFIDYLQLIYGISPGRRFDNRVNEISEVTKGLKDIAKEVSVPIVALSQLSRNVEQREDKRPQLSDLRESGSIEQDADLVMFIYREAYYLMRKAPREGTDAHQEWQQKMNEVKNQAEVILSKQRNGPTGTAKLHFDPNLTMFSNMDSNRDWF